MQTTQSPNPSRSGGSRNLALRPALSLLRSNGAKTETSPSKTSDSLESPSASSPPASVAAGEDSHGTGMSFLDLPSELRIMIYELLLISPDPIVISPRRRHLRFRVVTRPAANGNTYLRARRPTPEKSLVCQQDGLHVSLLGTCKQVNIEGTALLYGRNHFIVGQLLPFTGGGNLTAISDGYRALYFFPWSLRLSTLSQITSVTFRKACRCTTWLLLDNKEFTTDGPALRRKCFPGRGGKWRESQLPRTEHARETFKYINSQILAGKGPAVFLVCPRCHGRYDRVFRG